MEVNLLNLKNSINKAFLKVRPNRTRIELFKKNISSLFDQIKEPESEEFHKNIISEFLKNTYYSPDHYINTKDRADLVIHTGKDTNTPVGVLFETKKPDNRSEMPTTDNLNSKAFHELILYYLRERITFKNIEIKYLVATNILDWFIFNASDFEKLFASDKNLIKQFTDFEEGRLSGTNTDFFYKNIAEPFVEKIESQISVTYFDIRDFETIIKNTDRQDDNKLIALYKIFSPEHLLKLPFANDSNNLDKTFYNELLHIIGLEETKEGSKKIIGRKKSEKRNQASLIENAITILKSEDCLNQLPKRSDFGKDSEEQLFNVALELVITWINRILFLKLLEGQLIRYNNGDRAFRFLNTGRVHDYDELNKLFFQVLAVKEGDRNEKINEKFGNIPFLNSSLFETNDLEHKTIRISNLDEHFKLPVLSNTVLKDKTGKKLTGEIDTLQYLFEFLDSYDFSGEGSEDIQEENKTLINASVLGLIFEKINGYKDGSFFTPGFITMYMCHETIRRAVVQKFNETKRWKCETISDIYNKIEDIKEANEIINSLRICDPAVGSGHFLVSALNEIIAIKSELKVLADREWKKLKEYTIEVINDELIITDEQSNLFEYNPKSRESQRVQETLFLEKQLIIENCLFGVDINPNSVKICRLRLWIELLKNAYYKPEKPDAGRLTPGTVLETLPNIDINIKCGNSLISRYSLDADIKTALRSSKWNVDNYREAVMTYRNAQSKDEKLSMELLISKIKHDFETEVSKSDKRFLKLNKLNGDLLNLTNQPSLFEMTKTQKDEWNKKVKKLTEETKKFETELAEIKCNKIYENAFEWRFEFPEVLNNDGDFVGFDVVIGNPPYIYRSAEIEPFKEYFNTNYYNNSGNFDLYKYFIERSLKISSPNGFSSLITNSSFLIQSSFIKTRKFILENSSIIILSSLGPNIFEEATVDTALFVLSKRINLDNKIIILSAPHTKQIESVPKYMISQNRFIENNDLVFDHLLNDDGYKIVNKLFAQFPKMESGFEFGVGINTGYIKSELVSVNKIDDRYHPMVPGTGIARYGLVKSELYIMYDKQFVLSKGELGRTLPDEKFFTEQKILVVRTRNISLKQRIIAAIDTEKKYNLNRLSNIIAKKGYNILGLLGILNSELFNWLFSTRYIDYEIKPIYLRNSPLADTNNPKLIEKVSRILMIKKSDPAADTSALEAEIDRLVHELYGLTEEEIRIVEGD
ncbi:MAG: Eco57I restriction-modification methylase domain-containing protein [Bacteroidales bacterium]|nr:Eco57I restriction-modification methylase domain-containing protein [Bacteroidales bacterium]